MKKVITLFSMIVALGFAVGCSNTKTTTTPAEPAGVTTSVDETLEVVDGTLGVDGGEDVEPVGEIVGE